MKELYKELERFVHPVAGTGMALAAVMIRGDEAVFVPEPLVSQGGLEAKLKAGRPAGAEPVKVAWVAIRYSRGMPHGYAGLTVSEVLASSPGAEPDLEPIQTAIRRAVAAEVDVGNLSAAQREALRQELLAFNSQLWVQASAELKRALS